MEKKRKINRISLKVKTIFATLLMVVVLAGVAATISYRVYSDTIYSHYESMTMNLSKTIATALDKNEVEQLRDAVLRVYREACQQDGGMPGFEHYTETDWKAYYAKYAEVEKLPAYQNILKLLQEFGADNAADSIYIGYTDVDTGYGIYLIDGSINAEACPIGTADPVEDVTLESIRGGNYGFPPNITNYEGYGWLCSVGEGMYAPDGQVVGTLCVDISMDDVMQDRQEFLTRLLGAMSAISILLIIGMMRGMNHIIVSPINSLSRAAASFVSDKRRDDDGEPSAISAIEIHTGDEIENLCDSIKKMESELNTYIRELTSITAEKERIGAELNVATKIQADMLPCIFPAFPERHEFDIYATMTPAKEVGGDFYDFFLVDDDHLAMVMADVSGKGVPAALFMMISKTLLKSAAQTGLTPKAILEKVNNQLCENNDAEMFVTVWLGILEISTGHMICANAGHEYPAIRKAKGVYELFKDKHGFVLAGMENAKYKEYELDLEPGDSIFVYTDGVAEATDAKQELYGTDRMLQALNQKQDATCEELLGILHADVNLFVGDAPQFDDITMLCLAYNGPKEGE